MPLGPEAIAFNYCVELMSPAHVCGGNLVSGFGRYFLKACCNALLAWVSNMFYSNLRLFLHCFVLFVKKEHRENFENAQYQMLRICRSFARDFVHLVPCKNLAV